jgi:hypothetical protein
MAADHSFAARGLNFPNDLARRFEIGAMTARIGAKIVDDYGGTFRG